jgi:hypothetical protein
LLLNIRHIFFGADVILKIIDRGALDCG